MAGRDGVKTFTHSKVEAHCSLALERLQASDRQAKCSSHGIDSGLGGIEIRDGCEQFGTTEAPGHQLTVRNIDVGVAVLLEEIEDVVGRVECDWPKPHETRILLWPRCEDIPGRPEDQLGTPDTEIVKVGLELGGIVARGFDRRNAGGGGILLPETAVIRGVV